MKFLLFLAFCFFCFSLSFSQCSELKIKEKLQEAQRNRHTDKSLSIKAAEEVLICAEELGLERYKTNSLNILGFHNLFLGNTEIAYQQFQKSLLISKLIENDTAVAVAYNNLGNYYNYLGLDELALENYLQSLEQKRKLNLIDGIDVGLVNIGIIYDKQGKHIKAIDFYKEALTIKKNRNDENGVALINENLGIAYAELKQFEQAFDYLEQALDTYDLLNFKSRIIAIQITKAQIYADQQDFAQAEALLNEVKREVFESNEVTLIQQWYNEYKDIEIKRKNYGSARKLTDSSLVYARKASDLFAIIQLNEDLSKIKELTGDSLGAIKNMNIALKLKDSLTTVNNKVALEEMQLRYDTEVLNNQLVVQEKEIELLNLSNKNRTYLIVLIISLGSILLFAGYRKFKRNLQIKEEVEHELTLRNRELLSFTVQTAKKNEAIQKLKTSLNNVKEEKTDKDWLNRKEIQSLFKDVERTESDWEEFRMRFEKVEPKFFEKLNTNYKLSETDLRISALIKLNVTTQETANMLNITIESVNKARYRLRKKLNLPKEVELNSFLRTFG